MPNRIDHVALAVSDLDAALAHYRKVWGLEAGHRERVPDQGVEEAMLSLEDSFVQLIAPLGPDSSVGRFIERSGEGLHHLAFLVDDLAATLADLRAKGVRLIDEAPRPGGSGSLIAFVHPSGNHGLLVELIQRPGTEGQDNVV